MPKIIILGSSNAVPSIDHENTHLVIVGEERTILVDCVSTPSSDSNKRAWTSTP